MGFEFTGRDHRNAHIISVSGPCTSANLPQLSKAVECARGMGRRVLIFDFSKTTFIDSSMVGFIARLYKDLLNVNGYAALLNPSPRVKKSLEDANVFKVFRVFHRLGEIGQDETDVVDREDRGFYTLFRIPEEFNLPVAAPLRASLEELISGAVNNVVFDMSKTQMITSVGIGLLANIQKRLKEKGGGACVVGLTENVRMVLETTNSLRVIPEYATLKEVEEKLI